MASVSVDVDVELDDFDNDDLIDEICDRLKRGLISDKLRQKLRTSFNVITNNIEIIKVESIEDMAKYEHLSKVFNKYTSAEIERLLP